MGVSDIIEDILLQIHNGIGIIHPYNPLYGGFPLVTKNSPRHGCVKIQGKSRETKWMMTGGRP